MLHAAMHDTAAVLRRPTCMPLTRRDFGAVDTALNKLLELTMWQVVNQRAAMVGALIIPPPCYLGHILPSRLTAGLLLPAHTQELGAPSILMQLLRTKLEFVSPNVAEGKGALSGCSNTAAGWNACGICSWPLLCHLP